ncbi:MAG: hypothetical protein M3R13_02915, partial [Armatimonadota bacterium]|nr:hypothetical protein [Armatimonadota bacterium]
KNKDVVEIQIPLPPIADQKQIVGILDEAFRGIAAARVNAEQNLRSAGEAFASERECLFARGGAGWVEKPLSAICEIRHGFAFKSEHFSDSGEFVLLTPGNFFESGGYRDRGEKQKYYVGEIPDSFILSEGDLLVAMTEQAAGLLGSPMLVPASGRFLHNQRLGLVQKRAGVHFANEFFYHVFNLQRVRVEIHDSGTGVKVRHTSPTKIGKVVVSFPNGSIEDQRSVAAKLNRMSQETKHLESLFRQKLAALEALKKSILHQAFTGQLSQSSERQSSPI